MDKTNIKFVKGAAAGLALGIAAHLFLKSKMGKKIEKEISHTAADFYDYISPKIKKMGELTEEQYKEFMDKAVNQYIKLKEISADMAQNLREEVMDSWNYFVGREEA